ncbi:MAG TPA: hypothetical protein VGM88_03155 [Kofleriaceae bacterium]
MVEGLTGPGFYPQPNEYTCGPFALKHALLALGRMVDVKSISGTAKSNWWSGTNEIQLARAARAFECDLILERRRDEDAARKVLTNLLREQTPVLLCVDEWSHWITVLRAEDRRFVVVDSNDDPLLSVRTWPQLRNWWRYHDTEYSKQDPPVLFDLMAVQPRFRVTATADFSVERVKFLRRPENRHLALHWNEYLEDLLEICRPPSVRINEPLSMGEFLRRHQELLMTRVVYWHGDINREEAGRVLRDLRFVSETYGLVIPASASRRALADLAIVITMWACADRGVNPMFGSPGADVRGKPSRGAARKRARRAATKKRLTA